MTDDREHRGLVLAAILAAFALGIVFGVLARKYLPAPRVALAPGHADGSDSQPVLVTGSREVSGVRIPDSVPGNGTATAPLDYPVKGNERSGIYHVPGGFAYDRTVATVFFRSPEAAEAAGLRASKS